MPGIAGIVDFSQGRVQKFQPLQKRIQVMVSAMNHSEEFRLEFWSLEDEGIALGRADLPVFNKLEQPLSNEDQSLLMVCQGEIFDYEEERNRLKRRGHTFKSEEWGEFLLHLYEDVGEERIPQLNGAYNFALWDRKSKRLTLVNDRYGTYPLFYYYDHEKFLFASEIKAILQTGWVHPGRDPRGMADWFSFGFVLGEKTLFKNIHRFPLASIFRYDGEGLKKRVYWNPFFSPDACRGDERDWLDLLEGAFKNSVEKSLSGGEKIAVALTGGLDTRLIWSVIDEKRHPVEAVTFGEEGCADFQLAKKILRETNAYGNFISMDPSFFLDFPERSKNVVFLSDGNQTIYSAFDLSVYQKLRESFSLIVEGVGGEFIDRFWLKNYTPFIKSEEGLKNALFSSIHLPLDGLLSRDFVLENEEISRESFEDFYSRMNRKGSFEDKMDIFFLQGKYGYALTHGMNIEACYLGYRQPFLDYPFIDLVLKTPLQIRKKNLIHLHILRKNRLQLLRIKRSYGGGIPLPISQMRILKVLPILLHRGVQKFPFFKTLDPYKPFVKYGDWVRGPLRKYILEILLDSRTLDRGYFEPKAVMKMLSDHQKGMRDHWTQISYLITFELWNRLFFDRQGT